MYDFYLSFCWCEELLWLIFGYGLTHVSSGMNWHLSWNMILLIHFLIHFIKSLLKFLHMCSLGISIYNFSFLVLSFLGFGVRVIYLVVSILVHFPGRVWAGKVLICLIWRFGKSSVPGLFGGSFEYCFNFLAVISLFNISLSSLVSLGWFYKSKNSCTDVHNIV